MRVDIRHPSVPGCVLFSHSELACKASGQVILADGFADKLVMLRVAFGQPMIVNSCCRSMEYNDSMIPRGHPRSLHIYDKSYHGLSGCAAIDILLPSLVYAYKLIEAAIREGGWSFGQKKGMLHLDRRDFAGLPTVSFPYC